MAMQSALLPRLLAVLERVKRFIAGITDEVSRRHVHRRHDLVTDGLVMRRLLQARLCTI